MRSLLDHDVQWRASVSAQGQPSLWLKVVVAVMSLCPCSREISVYGAHNQRSHVAIEAEVLELIAIAERSSSCEVYGLLKRADEKYVTERAYENPKFVEDMVRDVAAALNHGRRVGAYTVGVENFESIHNHSAFARIADPARGLWKCRSACGRRMSVRNACQVQPVPDASRRNRAMVGRCVEKSLSPWSPPSSRCTSACG